MLTISKRNVNPKNIIIISARGCASLLDTDLAEPNGPGARVPALVVFACFEKPFVESSSK